MRTLYEVTVTLYVYADSKAEAYDIVEGEIDYHIHGESSESVMQTYSMNSVKALEDENV